MDNPNTQQDNVQTQDQTQDNQQTDQTQQQDQTLQTQQPADWKSQLSDDYKNDPGIEKFKDINGLAKSYKNLEKLVGRDKIPLPPENASKEDWDLVYSRLGRPSNPNEYKLPEETTQKIPKELVNEESMGEFNKVAHEAGLTSQQYEQVMDWYFDKTGQQLNEMNQQKETSKKKGETALRKEWGKAFDSKLGVAENALNKFGSDGLKQKLTKAGLNNDPEMIKFLAKLGEGLSEDTLSGKPSGSLLTPEKAQLEVAKIMGDANHPYWKKEHPEHKYAVERVESLNAMAYPEQE